MASFDRVNLRRLADALRDLGARLRAPGFTDEEAKHVAPIMLHPDTFQRTAITTGLTDAGPLDVLHDIPAATGERMSFERLVERSTTLHRDGLSVRVAALDDIMNSKLWRTAPKITTRCPSCARCGTGPMTGQYRLNRGHTTPVTRATNADPSARAHSTRPSAERRVRWRCDLRPVDESGDRC